ncbi:MAG TPA: 2OG-Fe(II) oxygenase [Aliidongia sp.]|nr:2OG-Fe(II) oxygenase [Aliidongia sp.]
MIGADSTRIAERAAAAFQNPARDRPFRHWLPDGILPEPSVRHLAGLGLPGDPLGDGGGRRETNNAGRAFLAKETPDPVCAALVQAFQSPELASTLAARCAADLDGTFLRIEYCQDIDGFWLEPHTDIAAKRFTLLVYLNDPPPGEDWGTDIYDGAGESVDRAPSGTNAGLAFVPGADTWHGFRRRPITGVRRSLIINYVVPEWRARHELAVPKDPVRLI